MQAADIIAAAAAAISFCSFAVSIGALLSQRDHDQKSVRPLPQIILGDYENQLSVAIENAGVGPFIIRSFIVEHVNSRVTKTSIIELLPSLPTGLFWTTYIEKLEQRAIGAKSTLMLCQLDEPEDGAEFAQIRRQMRDTLGYLRVTVEGEDIYGNSFSCTRLLDYFHRMYRGYSDSPKKLT